MKTASKVMIALFVSAVALVASQEAPRAYVANCFCSLVDCLFGS
jgi:hypothetical protein